MLKKLGQVLEAENVGLTRGDFADTHLKATIVECLVEGKGHQRVFSAAHALVLQIGDKVVFLEIRVRGCVVREGNGELDLIRRLEESPLVQRVEMGACVATSVSVEPEELSREGYVVEPAPAWILEGDAVLG